MKIFATLAAFAQGSALIQSQGARDLDGVQWSALRSTSAMAYQEAGESIVAFAGEVTETGKGIHTICYDSGPLANTCKTEGIRYSAYSWDGTSLTATGVDGLGPFTMAGGVVGDTTQFTRTYTAGPAAGLVGQVTLYALPDDSGLFYGEFDFTTNAGYGGNGRFASAFVDNAQTSFDEDE